MGALYPGGGRSRYALPAMADSNPKLSRLARLGGLTGRFTSSYVGQKLKGVLTDEDTRQRAMQRLHIDNARHVVETMSQMKGAAMKLGQQLAVATSAMDLPPEIASMLGKLHSEAEPVPFEHIREDIEKALEQPLSKLFASFDPKPRNREPRPGARGDAARRHPGRREGAPPRDQRACRHRSDGVQGGDPVLARDQA